LALLVAQKASTNARVAILSFGERQLTRAHTIEGPTRKGRKASHKDSPQKLLASKKKQPQKFKATAGSARWYNMDGVGLFQEISVRVMRTLVVYVLAEGRNEQAKEESDAAR
jgi:hypothetical protein